jgi:hypothetical protein
VTVEQWRTKRAEDIPIIWEDPPEPPIYRSPSHWRKAILDRFKAELSARPGQWAVLPLDGLDNPSESTLKTYARAINKPSGSWAGFGGEARVADGKVYVRKISDTTGV